MKNMAGSEEFPFNLKEFFTNRKTKVRGETGSMERKNHENDDGRQGGEEKVKVELQFEIHKSKKG